VGISPGGHGLHPGAKIKDEYDPKVVKHAARLGAELGADIVKVKLYRKTRDISGSGGGQLHPGGDRRGNPRWRATGTSWRLVKGATEAGAGGASIGRNAFQHRNPAKIVRAISLIVHENASVDEALKVLGGKK